MNSTPKKKVTINDVARYAKTSKTSVSRYLNGEFISFSEPLKKRIETAITELDYRPNQIARSLKKGKTKLIAYIVPDIKNPYSIDVMQGIEIKCQERGYSLLVLNSNNDLDKENNHLKLLTTYNVEGAIVHPIKSNPLSSLPNGLPIVFLDRKIKNSEHCFVGIDNIQSSMLIIDHLISKNFTDILLVTGSRKDISTRLERINVFKSINKTHKDITVTIFEINQENDDLDKFIYQFYQSRKTTKKVLVGVNGALILQIALSLKRLNLTIGKDVGLSGFDDPIWAELVSGGITCLKQPTEQIGLLASGLLFQQIDTQTFTSNSQIHLPGQLIVRNSTR